MNIAGKHEKLNLQERNPNFTKQTVAALLASTALVSCGTNTHETPVTQPTPEATTEITPDCDPDGQPMTAEQMLCDDRRTGTVAILTIPGLQTDTPTLDLSPSSTDVMEAAEYATNMLRLASDGEIDLTPVIVPVSPEVVQEINEKNSDGCIDTTAPSGLMGNIAQKNMPELAEHEHVVAIGGQACVTDNGGHTGGVAGYTTFRTEADIYNNELPRPLVSFGDETPVSTIGGTMAHELLHNFGLGHSGILSLDDPKAGKAILDAPTGVIDLEAYMQLPGRYDEYGAFGNIMSNQVQPMEPNADSLADMHLDPIQNDFIYESINETDGEGIVPTIYLDQITVTVDPRQTDSPKGASMPLGHSVGHSVMVGEHAFSMVSFLPDMSDDKTSLDIRIILSTTNGQLLNTAVLGRRSLDVASDEVVFRLEENREVTVTTTDGRVDITLNK